MKFLTGFIVIVLSLLVLGVFLYAFGIVKPVDKKKTSTTNVQSKNVLTPKNIEIPSKPSSFLPEKIKKEAEEISNKENYITPKDYNIGLMKPPEPYCSVDNCNPNVLYPIQQPGVFYGSEACVNAPCTEFIRSP